MDGGQVRDMADEVAALIAERFGGLRRGQRAGLATMMRRRGAALPRHLRREAARLVRAEAMSGAPRVARQLDPEGLVRAHRALTAHLRPLGKLSRWQGRAVSVAASVALGLLVICAAVVWVLVWRGYL